MIKITSSFFRAGSRIPASFFRFAAVFFVPVRPVVFFFAVVFPEEVRLEEAPPVCFPVVCFFLSACATVFPPTDRFRLLNFGHIDLVYHFQERETRPRKVGGIAFILDLIL
ncbi:MAG: hypothetical protein V8S96_03130 [Lachnospiraceae bacterium]